MTFFLRRLWLGTVITIPIHITRAPLIGTSYYNIWILIQRETMGICTRIACVYSHQITRAVKSPREALAIRTGSSAFVTMAVGASITMGITAGLFRLLIFYVNLPYAADFVTLVA
jgi:hypothetical protein